MRPSPKTDGSDDRDLALIDAAMRDASHIEANGGAVLDLEFDRAIGKPGPIPGYEFRDEIHNGAQSIVYRAIQTGTNRVSRHRYTDNECSEKTNGSINQTKVEGMVDAEFILPDITQCNRLTRSLSKTMSCDQT